MGKKADPRATHVELCVIQKLVEDLVFNRPTNPAPELAAIAKHVLGLLGWNGTNAKRSVVTIAELDALTDQDPTL